jgi:small subunit ribosomal protein S16
MIKIRLARGGRKKNPFYRIVATNITSPRDSKFLEKLGTFNPLVKSDDENRITINKERVEHWLSVGAQPTEKLAKFFIALGVKGAEKYKPTYVPKEKGSNLKKKAAEKVAQAKEAAEEAKAAEVAAAEEAKAAEVAAAEEAKAAKVAEAEAAKAAAEAPAEKAEEKAEAPAEEKSEEKAAETPAS